VRPTPFVLIPSRVSAHAAKRVTANGQPRDTEMLPSTRYVDARALALGRTPTTRDKNYRPPDVATIGDGMPRRRRRHKRTAFIVPDKGGGGEEARRIPPVTTATRRTGVVCRRHPESVDRLPVWPPSTSAAAPASHSSRTHMLVITQQCGLVRRSHSIRNIVRTQFTRYTYGAR
jgi:hypothetical protein